jgi:hypothetical protein
MVVHASRLSCFTLLALALSTAAALELSPMWEAVFPGDLQAELDSAASPTVRYGSAAVVLPETRQLLVSHGYFFRHDVSATAWLNDTWTLTLDDSVHHRRRWQRVATAGQRPTARYKHVLVGPVQGVVYLHGGDDGGGVAARSHVWGSFSAELYRLHLKTMTWSLVATNAASGGAPSPVAGHCGLVWRETHIVVAFGMTSTSHSTVDAQGLVMSADVWALDLSDLRWNRWWDAAPPTSNTHSSGPRGRRLATFTKLLRDEDPAQHQQQFALAFGGYDSRTGSGAPKADDGNLDDAWIFDFVHRNWSPVIFTSPAAAAPRARGGHAAASLRANTVVITGGATCNPSCTCHSDVWMLTVVVSTRTDDRHDRAADQRVGMWARLEPPSPIALRQWPIARHNMAFAADESNSALLIVGGESYRPYAYWNDVWNLRFRPLPVLSSDAVGTTAREAPQQQLGQGWGSPPYVLADADTYPRMLMLPLRAPSKQQQSAHGLADTVTSGTAYFSAVIMLVMVITAQCLRRRARSMDRRPRGM